jgi:hypothetical protein
MTRSEFFDEAWAAWVEADEHIVTVEVMLTGVGVAGRARLTLPAGHVRDALAALVAVLYGDEELLRHAVRVHLEQHPAVPEVSLSTSAKQAGVASVAKRAVRAKLPSCARRSRR